MADFTIDTIIQETDVQRSKSIRKKAYVMYEDVLKSIQNDQKKCSKLYTILSSLNINNLSLKQHNNISLNDMTTYLDAVMYKIHFTTTYMIDKALNASILPTFSYCKEYGVLLQHIACNIRVHLVDILSAIAYVYRGLDDILAEKENYTDKATSLSKILASICYNPENIVGSSSNSSSSGSNSSSDAVSGGDVASLPSVEEMMYCLMVRFQIASKDVFDIFAKEHFGLKKGDRLIVIASSHAGSSREALTDSQTIREMINNGCSDEQIDQYLQKLQQQQLQHLSSKKHSNTVTADDVSVIDDHTFISDAIKEIDEYHASNISIVEKLSNIVLSSKKHSQTLRREIKSILEVVHDEKVQCDIQQHSKNTSTGTGTGIGIASNYEVAKKLSGQRIYKLKLTKASIVEMESIVEELKRQIIIAKKSYMTDDEVFASEAKGIRDATAAILTRWQSVHKVQLRAIADRALRRYVKYWRQYRQWKVYLAVQLQRVYHKQFKLQCMQRKLVILRRRKDASNIVGYYLYRIIAQKRVRNAHATVIQRFLTLHYRELRMRRIIIATKQALYGRFKSIIDAQVLPLQTRLKSIELSLSETVPADVMTYVHSKLLEMNTRISNAMQANDNATTDLVRSEYFFSYVSDVRKQMHDMSGHLHMSEKGIDNIKLAINSCVRMNMLNYKLNGLLDTNKRGSSKKQRGSGNSSRRKRKSSNGNRNYGSKRSSVSLKVNPSVTSLRNDASSVRLSKQSSSAALRKNSSSSLFAGVNSSNGNCNGNSNSSKAAAIGKRRSINTRNNSSSAILSAANISLLLSTHKQGSTNSLAMSDSTDSNGSSDDSSDGSSTVYSKSNSAASNGLRSESSTYLLRNVPSASKLAKQSSAASISSKGEAATNSSNNKGRNRSSNSNNRRRRRRKEYCFNDDDDDEHVLLNQYNELVRDNSSVARQSTLLGKLGKLVNRSDMYQRAVAENDSLGFRDMLLSSYADNANTGGNANAHATAAITAGLAIGSMNEAVACVVSIDRPSHTAIDASMYNAILSDAVRNAHHDFHACNHRQHSTTTTATSIMIKGHMVASARLVDIVRNATSAGVPVSTTKPTAASSIPIVHCKQLLLDTYTTEADFDMLLSGTRQAKQLLWLMASISDIFATLPSYMTRQGYIPSINLDEPQVISPIGFSISLQHPMHVDELTAYSAALVGIPMCFDVLKADVSIRVSSNRGPMAHSMALLKKTLRLGNDSARLTHTAITGISNANKSFLIEEDIDTAFNISEVCLAGCARINVSECIVKLLVLNKGLRDSSSVLLDIIWSMNRLEAVPTASMTHIFQLITKQSTVCGPIAILTCYVLSIIHAVLKAGNEVQAFGFGFNPKLFARESVSDVVNIPSSITISQCIHILQYLYGCKRSNWRNGNDMIHNLQFYPSCYAVCLRGVLLASGVADEELYRLISPALYTDTFPDATAVDDTNAHGNSSMSAAQPPTCSKHSKVQQSPLNSRLNSVTVPDDGGLLNLNKRASLLLPKQSTSTDTACTSARGSIGTGVKGDAVDAVGKVPLEPADYTDLLNKTRISPFDLIKVLIDLHTEQMKDILFAVRVNELFRVGDVTRVSRISRKEFRSVVLSVATRDVVESELTEAYCRALVNSDDDRVHMDFKAFVQTMKSLVANGTIKL